ncbi:hypothetical protein P7228_04725 [Altererythrobacter arenosus]|uniref:Uncharacterized protein n=1 Tax=Altererythrobacter arenosus TaxID=3032592 RepID=A0ABY8FTN7_9SPHN|nr:hypothetical protein [Altererythrobacter sp. CAU 1644]WFL78371.1 hypothetical protein P7228_04725 [Altererythrobacter sp. CAU 1644]
MKILMPTAALLLAAPALADDPAADNAVPIKELEASGSDSAEQLFELQQQMEMEQRFFLTADPAVTPAPFDRLKINGGPARR